MEAMELCRTIEVRFFDRVLRSAPDSFVEGKEYVSHKRQGTCDKAGKYTLYILGRENGKTMRREKRKGEKMVDIAKRIKRGTEKRKEKGRHREGNKERDRERVGNTER